MMWQAGRYIRNTEIGHPLFHIWQNKKFSEEVIAYFLLMRHGLHRKRRPQQFFVAAGTSLPNSYLGIYGQTHRVSFWKDTDGICKHNLCGGWLEHLHRSPASRRRRRRGNPVPEGITEPPCSWGI
jgi:hypothetical protein